jgi:hypothetical protein
MVEELHSLRTGRCIKIGEGTWYLTVWFALLVSAVQAGASLRGASVAKEARGGGPSSSSSADGVAPSSWDASLKCISHRPIQITVPFIIYGSHNHPSGVFNLRKAFNTCSLLVHVDMLFAGLHFLLPPHTFPLTLVPGYPFSSKYLFPPPPSGRQEWGRQEMSKGIWYMGLKILHITFKGIWL